MKALLLLLALAGCPGQTVPRAPRPAVAPAPIPDVWLHLADCESNQTWDYDGPSGFDGGLQFLPATWTAFRPDHYPAHAHEATPRQQVEVAERVLQVQGWQAWPVCSRKLGLR